MDQSLMPIMCPQLSPPDTGICSRRIGVRDWKAMEDEQRGLQVNGITKTITGQKVDRLWSKFSEAQWSGPHCLSEASQRPTIRINQADFWSWKLCDICVFRHRQVRTWSKIEGTGKSCTWKFYFCLGFPVGGDPLWMLRTAEEMKTSRSENFQLQKILSRWRKRENPGKKFSHACFLLQSGSRILWKTRHVDRICSWAHKSTRTCREHLQDATKRANGTSKPSAYFVSVFWLKHLAVTSEDYDEEINQSQWYHAQA